MLINMKNVSIRNKKQYVETIDIHMKPSLCVRGNLTTFNYSDAKDRGVYTYHFETLQLT